MDELQRQAAEMRTLAELPPTPERWAAVRVALTSKFEGTQAGALRVLGGWGGREAVEALRGFLTQAFSRRTGWAVRSVATRALAGLVTAADVPWILDLYFGLPGTLEKHELMRLVITLPPEAARDRLVAELRSADPLNRQAAVKAIGNMPYEDRRQLLWPLREDPHKFVGKSARLLTQET